MASICIKKKPQNTYPVNLIKAGEAALIPKYRMADDHDARVETEVAQLKKDIVRLGAINAEGQYEVPFGVLFDDEQGQQFYEAIVGTIKAAKKRGVVDAKGMIWLKGAHDKVPIKLLESPTASAPPEAPAASGREVPVETRASFESFWASDIRQGLQRVPLLKAMEAATAAVYEREHLVKVEDEALRSHMKAVVLESNMAGLEEFGDVWFQCIKAKMVRMTLCADWVLLAMALEESATGFDTYERALISGAARMLPPYHEFYLAYLAAVQDEAVVSAFKATPPPTSRADLYSSYTVNLIDAAAEGGFKALPFATHFAPSLGPVLVSFDTWISELAAAETTLGSTNTALSYCTLILHSHTVLSYCTLILYSHTVLSYCH
jgi:hypothetical protein